MDSKKEDRVLMLGEGPKDLVEGSWCEVADLKPNMRKLKLLVEVLSNEVIVKKGEWKTKRLNHCLVADGSASVLFCARNEQVDLLVPGTKALMRNAEVQMYMDRIYLVVGSEGDIVDDISAEADFKVNLAQNVSDKIY